jgi:biotin--protein ligase
MARLAAADKSRIAFLKACLGKLGLEPNETTQTIPSLSPLHLSSINDSGVTEMLCSWESIMDRENGLELIRGEADTFLIQTRNSQWDMDGIRDSLPQDGKQTKPEEDISPLNYESVVKKIVAHETSLPSTKQTPRFDHQLYYSSLKRFQLVERQAASWGNVLLYGDVVTSTNTLLEKYDSTGTKHLSFFHC